MATLSGQQHIEITSLIDQAWEMVNGIGMCVHSYAGATPDARLNEALHAISTALNALHVAQGHVDAAHAHPGCTCHHQVSVPR